MLKVGIFILIAKTIGLVKEMVIAAHFGVNEAVDAYLLVFNLVNYPVNVWLSVMSAVLIPFLVSIRTHSHPERSNRFLRELLGATILAALGLGLALAFLLPWLVAKPWLNLNNQQIIFAHQMALPLAWLASFGLINGLFSTWTMAANRHVNTLFESAPALMIVCAVMLVGSAGALAWGVLAGFALQTILLAVTLMHFRELVMPTFRFRSYYWKPFISGAGIMLLGQMFISAGNTVDHLFAARLGPGAISTLGYANRVVALILSLGATSIGRAILPVLSRISTHENRKLNRIVFQWSGLLFGGGVLVVGIGYLGAPLAIKILFERGAFSAQDSEAVVGVFRFGLAQIPVYFASMVAVYALLSRKEFKLVAFIAFVAFAVKVVILPLMTLRFGVNGIPLSNMFVYTSSTLIALFRLTYVCREQTS